MTLDFPAVFTLKKKKYKSKQVCPVNSENSWMLMCFGRKISSAEENESVNV